MFPDYYWNLVLIGAILGAFVAFQFWQLRQIERETPPRDGERR
jgi:hypothetical protein